MLIEDDSSSLKALHDSLVTLDFSATDFESQDYKRNRTLQLRLNFFLQKQDLEYDKENNCVKASSILQEHIENPSYRDYLLKIGKLSPEFSLMKTFDSQDCMEKISKTVTGQVVDSLSDSFV